MIESALGWIGQVAEWVGQFIPRIRNVRSTHAAAKFSLGRLKVAGPGLRLYWPLITDFVEYPTVRQAVGLREQTLVTMDDKTIVVGGMIIYEVEDMKALCGQTYSPDQTVRDLALTSVHDVCCKMDWATLKNEQRKATLDTKLKNESAAALKPYGVRVVKLMLTDLAPCRVLRLVQTGAVKED